MIVVPTMLYFGGTREKGEKRMTRSRIKLWWDGGMENGCSTWGARWGREDLKEGVGGREERENGRGEESPRERDEMRWVIPRGRQCISVQVSRDDDGGE